jgi:hypothetical protein
MMELKEMTAPDQLLFKIMAVCPHLALLDRYKI